MAALLLILCLLFTGAVSADEIRGGGGGGGGSGDITSVWTDTSGDVSALIAGSGDTFNAAAADWSIPTTQSTSLAGTCTQGWMHQKTDAGGSITYVCSATDTWSKLLIGTDNIATATALASDPSDCSANQFANAIAVSGNLTCGAIGDADVPDTITVSNYLPLAGGTLTGQIVTDNLGVEFDESDTNPTCAAGNFNIFADLSEGKLKKCTDGVASDLDTTGGTPGGSTTQVQYNNAGAFGGISGATTDGTTLTLVAPVLGAATATSINKVVLTAPATAATLTLIDSTVVTGPAATGTLATLAGTESLTNKKLGSLTTNGFVKTSNSDGTLSVDTTTYLSTIAPLILTDANTVEQYNGTTTQAFNLYRTRTNATTFERLMFGYGIKSANTWGFRMLSNSDGSGTARSFEFVTNGNTTPLTVGATVTSSPTVQIGLDTTSAALNGRLNIGSASATTATSGNHYDVHIQAGASTASTSTLNYMPLRITGTVNYANATPGSGHYEMVSIAAVETALPTGTNYLIRAAAGVAGTTDKFTVTNAGVVDAIGGYKANGTAGVTVTTCTSFTLGICTAGT